MKILTTALVAVFLCAPAWGAADESWLSNTRNQCVYTNLDDSGVGSLRNCIGANTDVRPDPSLTGTIQLQDWLVITDEDVTISGLSEAGPISIYGAPVQIKRSRVKISDFSIDPGPAFTGQESLWATLQVTGSDNCSRTVEDVIIEHVSLYNSVAENVALWGTCTHDITLEDSIIGWARANAGHPKGEHAKNILIGTGITGVLVRGNLIASSTERNPVVHQGASAAVLNSVIYNSRNLAFHFYGYGSAPSQADVAGNVIIQGPDTRNRLRIGQGSTNEVDPGSSIYINDNRTVGEIAWGNYEDVTNLQRVYTPHFAETAFPSQLTERYVANNAGPTFKSARDYQALWCALSHSMAAECAIADDPWPVAPVYVPPPVNSAPDAIDDTVTTAFETPVTFDPRVNDTDPESDPLTITGVTQPTYGTSSYTSGDVTYSPSAAFTGADSFTYTISDGDLTDTATVNVTVEDIHMYDFDGVNEWLENGNGLAAGADNTETSGFLVVEWDALDGMPITTASALSAGNSRMSIKADTPNATGDYRVAFDYRFTTAVGRWVTDDDFSFGDRLYIAWSYDRTDTTTDPILWISTDGVTVTKYTIGSNLTENISPAGTATTGTDSIRIGANVAGSNDFDGRAGRMALWTDAHTDARAEALCLGASPLSYSTNLAHYWPLLNDLNDDVGSANLTANGTPTPVPTVFVPQSSITFAGLTPAPKKAANVPVGSISLTGQNPTGRMAASVPAGSLAFTGQVPTGAKKANVPAGSIAFTEQTPTGRMAASLPVGEISFSPLVPTRTGPLWSAVDPASTSWSVVTPASTTWTPQ